MVKALLMSLIIAHVAIPAYFAKSKNPRMGVKRMVTWMVVFNFFYMLALLYVYPRLEG